MKVEKIRDFMYIFDRDYYKKRRFMLFYRKRVYCMLSEEKINRINELSKKAKITELTLAESKEQQQLRQEYIETFRSSFKNQLHSIKVVDGEGTDVTPEKLKASKKKNQSN